MRKPLCPSDIKNGQQIVVIKGWSLTLAQLPGSEYFMPSLPHELQPDELDHFCCGLTSFL